MMGVGAVKAIVEIVINPYEENDSDELNIEEMTVIDDGDYQGTLIYVIPQKHYQPDLDEYVWTHNYYGSCSGCDTLMSVQDCEDLDYTIQGIMTIALHLIENMRVLGE